jgi:hypothetical protein
VAYVVQDHVNAALRKLGVLAESEVPDIGQSNDALFALNALVDQWQGDRGKIPAVVATVGTLTPSKQTYTVGPGGDINIARPDIIDHVTYINNNFSPAIELPLQELTSDAWALVPIKSQTSPLPTMYYYDYSFSSTGTANLNFWLIPTSANLQYSLWVPTPFAQFATLQTAVLLPPGYWRMLDNLLALELAPEYGVEPSQILQSAAQDAENIVLRNASKLMDMQMDAGALVQGDGNPFRWSIYAGP